MIRRAWISLDRLVTRSAHDDETYVRDPRSSRRLAVAAAAWMLSGMGATLVLVWSEPGPMTAAASGLLGVMVARAAMARMRRATSYRSGWLKGRLVMVNALSESLRRGMSVEEWLQAEFERDAKILGLVGHRDHAEDDR